MAAFPAGYTMVPDGAGGMVMQPLYQPLMANMQNGYSTVNYQQLQNAGQTQMMQSPQQQVVYPQQNMQQSVVQQTSVPGKIVESVDFVKVADIPMDNKTYYFPKADGNEIYTKKWRDDGNTEIVTYVKKKEAPTDETKQFVSDMFASKKDIQEVQQMQIVLGQKLNEVMDVVSKLEQAFK